MKNYRFYIFDFDGTLVDTLPSYYRVYLGAFKSIGIDVKEEDCVNFFGESLQNTFKYVNPDSELYDTFVKTLIGLLNEEETIKLSKLYPEVFSFLKELNKRRIPYSIVTGNSIQHVKDVFNFLGINSNKFNNIIGAGSGVKAKPSGEGILKSLEEAHYIGNMDDVVYIGDLENDYLAAKDAGVDCYLVDRDNKLHNVGCKKISSLMELFYEK